MESMPSILNMIQQKQENFPAAQKMVAAYVIKNYDSIPFLSITTLAQNIHVSEKTVIKFCNSIGFEKFADFKRAFAEYAQSRLVITNKLTQAEQEANPHDIFDMTVKQDTDSILATMNLEGNRTQLPKLIHMLTAARHIYVTGGRASGIIAQMFVNMLRYLSLKVHELPLDGNYYDRLTMIEAEDVVIAFCFSRYTAQIVDGLQYLNKNNIPIALFTDMELSPAFPYAEVVFYCEAAANGYFPTYAGCMSLIYAICSELSMGRSHEAASHTRQLEQLLMDKAVFK